MKHNNITYRLKDYDVWLSRRWNIWKLVEVINLPLHVKSKTMVMKNNEVQGHYMYNYYKVMVSQKIVDTC